MIKNITANFIGRFWSILSNFLFIPLYIKYLGFESYGIISFTLVIAGLMAIVDAGLTATLLREFSRVDNHQNEKIRVFKTLETTFFILISLCIAIVFLFSDIIAINWLNVNNFDASRVSFFIRIISFDVGFQLFFRFYMGGLFGLEKQIKANFFQVGWGMLRNGVVVVAILIVPTLEVFFVWQMFCSMLFAILIRFSLTEVLMGRYIVDFKPELEIAVFKKIWRFTGGMLLISLVAGLNTQMDKMAISKYLPVEVLGYYTLAVSLSMGIVVLVSPISIALLPKFTALYSNNEKDKASLLYDKYNLIVAVLVFSSMSVLIFFAKEVLWVWTGNLDLANKTSVFLPIISFSFAMLALSVLPYNIAVANGYTKLNNIVGLSSLIITIPGYWIITKYFGAIGAAYVFCTVQLMGTIIYTYVINKKFVKLNLKKMFFKQIFSPLLISLCLAFVLSFIPELFKSNRFLCLLWIGVGSFLILIFSFLILIPSSEIKQLANFKNILKSK